MIQFLKKVFITTIRLANRMRELSYLNKGIRISMTDKRVTDEEGEHPREEFYSEGGLKLNL